MHWVCVTFVVFLPVVKGGVTFSAKEAPSKRKIQVEGVWRILLDCCVDVEEQLVEYARCLCILCACMSVVKGYVVFSVEEAPMKGKTGRVEFSKLLPSLL